MLPRLILNSIIRISMLTGKSRNAAISKAAKSITIRDLLFISELLSSEYTTVAEVTVICQVLSSRAIISTMKDMTVLDEKKFMHNLLKGANYWPDCISYSYILKVVRWYTTIFGLDEYNIWITNKILDLACGHHHNVSVMRLVFYVYLMIEQIMDEYANKEKYLYPIYNQSQ